MRIWNEKILLWVALLIPLDQQGSWEILKYRSLKPNAVQFSAEGLHIEVNGSASPLIYPFSKAVKVSGILIKGRLQGEISIPQGKHQGAKGADDFTVRIGLVLAGSKRLSKWQSLVAPDWIKRLHALAPSDGGIDHIEFFNVYQDSTLAGTTRQHPKSELLVENFVVAANADGEFELKKSFLPFKEVIALWLSSDGDDSSSKFAVTIKSIQLDTEKTQ